MPRRRCRRSASWTRTARPHQVGPDHCGARRSALDRGPRAATRPRRLHRDLAGRLRDRRPRHCRRLRVRRARRADGCRRDDRQHEPARLATRDGGALDGADRPRRAARAPALRAPRGSARRAATCRLGAGGWLAVSRGLVLLAEAQRRIADTSAGALLRTPVGHALVWRGVAIGAAGVALLVARRAVRLEATRRDVGRGARRARRDGRSRLRRARRHRPLAARPVGGPSVGSFRRGGNLDRRAGGTAARSARRPERRQGGGDPPLRVRRRRRDSS